MSLRSANVRIRSQIAGTSPTRAWRMFNRGTPKPRARTRAFLPRPNRAHGNAPKRSRADGSLYRTRVRNQDAERRSLPRGRSGHPGRGGAAGEDPFLVEPGHVAVVRA